jgi:hypothetical protein
LEREFFALALDVLAAMTFAACLDFPSGDNRA